MHQHHGAIPIARLAFAVADEAGLVRGVAIVGRPCNTHLDDGWTLEVRRVCTLEPSSNEWSQKRVVEITRQMAHGVLEQAEHVLKLSRGGKQRNTAFSERLNGTLRERGQA